MKRLIVLALMGAGVNFTYAQTVIKGIVLDIQTNQPIPGATIMVAGKAIGKATDNNGAFQLPTAADSITVSCVGYSTKTVKAILGGSFLVLLEPSNTAMNEVIVEGNGTRNKILQTPRAVGLITGKDIARTNTIFLWQSLNLVPGVKMEMRNNTQGARIVIRGYGNETNFNGNGYKAYLNGIPVTDADGTTFLDDIDFTNLGRLEVIKGSASTLYGNSIGGVVLMQMQKAETGQTSFTEKVIGGQDGLFRTTTSYKTGSENSSVFANYGHQIYQGFRMHGSSRKDFVNLGADFYSGKRTITVFASYAKGFDYLPGQVSDVNLKLHPDSMSLDYYANDAHVNFENFKMSIGQDYRIGNNFSNNTSVFLVGTFLDQPSAAGLSRANKYKYGARSVFVYSPIAGTLPLQINFGGELIKNSNFQPSYTLTNNVLGALRADQEIFALQYNIFAQVSAKITKSTTLTVGGGENFLEYTINDLRATTGTPPTVTYYNQSGYKRFTPVFAPSASITQLINNNVAVYATVSKGFSAPATSQVLIIPSPTTLGTPSVNFGLNPETAVNYEIGSKGSVFKNQLNYDIALYTMDVTNKLVTEYPVSTYSITYNAGKVRHQGLELSLSYAKQLNGGFFTLVKPFLSYTLSNFKYVTYWAIPADPSQQSPTNNGKDSISYAGNHVEGIPNNLFNAGLDLESKPGLYFNATYMYVDKMPVDFVNVHYAAAYSLLNAKLGFRKLVSKHFDLDIFVGEDNITNTHYATHVFLNTRDYPKIYNPMPLANWYAGTTLKFIL